MMISIASKIANKLWTFFILLTIFLIVSIFTLHEGIKIDNFTLPGLKIDKLYIKLDKKLIVQIKKIKIKFKKSKIGSKEELYLAIKRLPWLNIFFSIVDIKHLDIEDNHITLLYKDDIFYLNSKYLIVDTKLYPFGEKLKADINSLVFKDFNITLKGEMIGNPKNFNGNFKGTYKTHGIQGDLKLKIIDKMLYYEINSENFNSLKPFMEALNKKIEIDNEINSWIYKKITATDYKLLYLKGKFNLKNNKFYPKSMSARAKTKNVKIRFHKNVPFVSTKALDVILIDNTLHFLFNKAFYKNLKLKKSNIYIYNLLTNGAGIVINLATNAPLNENIQKILKAYELNVPILQTSGKGNSKLKLDIKFLPYDIDIKGEFFVKNSNIKIANAPFYTEHAHILLDNHLITLKNTNLTYKNIFNIDSNGVFNLQRDRYDGKFKVKSININMSKNNLIEIKNRTLPVSMKIKTDRLLIKMPTIKTYLNFYEHKNTIEQKELALIYKNSPFMQKSNIYNGTLYIDTKDFEKYIVDLNLSNIKPIFIKNGNPVTALNLRLKIDKSNTNILSTNRCLNLTDNGKKTLIKINKCDLLIETNSSHSSNLDATIKAKNSNIILKDLNTTIVFDSFQANLYKKYLYFDGKYKKGSISLNKKPKLFSLNIKNIDDSFMNNLLKEKIFDEGRFKTNIKGKNFDNFSGYLHFEKTFIKSFSFYNNLIAFINSIPSLLTFKQPSFNEKGYAIKNANIIFSKQNNILKIHSIDILGIDADIVGNGVVDLKTKKIDIKISLKTLKVLSDIIKKIPLVNFILLGEDKSISTFISIKGTLDNPIIETQAAKEMVLTPFNLIKRTISLPFSIFD